MSSELPADEPAVEEKKLQRTLQVLEDSIGRNLGVEDGGDIEDGHQASRLYGSMDTNSTSHDKNAAPKDDDDTPTPGSVPASNSSSTHEDSPSVPRLSRAFSMPLPSQTSHWQHPGRSPLSVDAGPSSVTTERPQDSHFHDLALELADSVQLAVQTLFQLSPPHIFDPAKEQYSGCTVQIPIPSLTALLTSMKNLNYISANMRNLGSPADGANRYSYIDARAESLGKDEFDIGELLQNVGDSFGGVASEAEVDLVLHHGDALKHMGVRGDECGISYALSHILHQVLATARQGDSMEVGLSIGRQPSSSDDPNTSESDSPPTDSTGPVVCTFDIAHKFTTFIPSLTIDNIPASDDGLSEIQNTDPESVPTYRPEPYLGSTIFRRLLAQIGGTVRPSVELARGRRTELSVTLERGPSLAVLHQKTPAADNELFRDLSADIPLAREPSIDELMSFADSLKGKNVSFHANTRASFTIHLTKYLTTWGMDISHLPTDGTDDKDVLEDVLEAEVAGVDIQPILPENSNNATSEKASAADTTPSFIVIDDDVLTLRRRLLQYRAEMMPTLQPRKRPSLAAHHRPRSTPSIRNALLASGVQNRQAQSSTFTPFTPIPIVHFTSLGKYKLVKDVIQAILLMPGGPPYIPEVIVIPKPAGPRRILTSLYTAIRKPVIDPFFSPIATSPMTPGGHLSPFIQSGPSKEVSSPTAMRTIPERPPRTNSDSTSFSASSPLSMPDGLEYFSAETPVKKLGSTAASGLVIPGVDGRPAILFQPQSRSSSHRSDASSNIETTSPVHRLSNPSSRRTSYKEDGTRNTLRSPGPSSPRGVQSPTGGSATSPERPRLTSEESGHSFRRAASPRQDAMPRVGLREAMQMLARPSEGTTVPSLVSTPSTTGSRSVAQSPSTETVNSPPSLIRKPTSPGTSSQRSPLSPTGGEARRPGARRSTIGPKSPLGPSSKKPPTKTVGSNIVPPINVLLVEDNPINQTMVSTFMKRNKIKYEVAWNGKEAVDKWKTGNFHIILMDIQMPVMDGIEATKEIRRLEKLENIRHFPPSPAAVSRQSMGSTGSPDSQGSTASTPFRSQVIIVALTASSRQSDRVAALAAGCNDFLTKPVMTSWLADKIIEWGSIKALQMWAELRPDIEDTISHEQQAQAQAVAEKLHVPPPIARRSPTGGQAALPGKSDSKASEGTEGGREPRSLIRSMTPASRELSKDSSSSSSSPERWPNSSDEDMPGDNVEPPAIVSIPDMSPSKSAPEQQQQQLEITVQVPTPDVTQAAVGTLGKSVSNGAEGRDALAWGGLALSASKTEDNVSGLVENAADTTEDSALETSDVRAADVTDDSGEKSPEEVTGETALRQYIEQTKETDTYTQRPTLLGHQAIQSHRSSKSIASVLHETPAVGEDPKPQETTAFQQEDTSIDDTEKSIPVAEPEEIPLPSDGEH
ncbi:hypothetical protein M422DRAFT_35883 [Sphaerobolus stellatus SS14]|uniref:Response regulatory domain-containing protein n=1 Tax=Sphaerobolus stellatus (strain SS14) TaxID=990650 RepID=A0A0C9V4G3_SPHS4|nr:hypothetical protein M422DRAFT_35883 [Sphaerobolus stellatus SS14]